MERLKEEQSKAIQESNARIDQLKKFKDDYIELEKRLKTLPDKVSHNIMVPFGNMAFMPGTLVHTNEIMVLLGDNWFAERSAKQAAEIASRRVNGVEEQISNLEKQKGLLEPRLEYTQELEQAQQDVVEIKEVYDPEKEALWKEQHKRNVRAHKNEMMGVEEPGVQTSDDRELTDDRLWARLQQLEIQERLGHEYTRLGDEEQPQSKSVRWQDAESTTSQVGQEGDENDDTEDDDEDDDEYEDDSDDENSENDKPEPRHTSSIKFCHTKPTDLPKLHSHTSADPGGEPCSDHILSPADIYKKFVEQPSQPKSILKPPKPYPDVEEMTSQLSEVKQRVILPGSQDAFSGEVKEHITESAEIPALSQPVKRVSRFKQQRQAKKQ